MNQKGFIWLCALSILCTCSEKVKEKSDNDALALSKTYCSSCHAFPNPQLLDQQTWENYVLPRMGYFLGVYDNSNTRQALIEEGEGEYFVEQSNIFPKKPLIATDEWETIKSYYLENSPSELPSTQRKESIPLTQFEFQIPNYHLSPPSSTYIQIEEGACYLGDALTQGFYQFNDDLELLNMAKTREGIVDMTQSKNHYYLSIMGSFSPTDNPSGLILELPKSPQLKPRILLDKLKRPVHSVYDDLNGDKIMDLVICEFGKWTGSLSLFEGKAEGGFEKHVLRNKPGATKAYIKDLNQDGLKDIIALFAQGDEGIFVYYNEGKNQFKEEKLIEFPSTYGSSYFDIFDYNNDTYPDIIYTAGDNADYPPLLKPYHGIRIFENNGQNQFKEIFFYPLHGAYKAIPSDFDQDGDLDIAAISFFPDFEEQPEEGFIYLENQGEWNFMPHHLEIDHLGRWITMDTGDLDGDGDQDIALGALTFEVVPPNPIEQQWTENGIPFIILWNQLNKPH